MFASAMGNSSSVPLKEGENPESYRDTIRSTNEHFTGISEFLSNSIYLYKRDTGENVKVAVEDGDGSRGVLKAGFHAEHDCKVQVPEMGYLGQELPVGIVIDEKIEYCLPGLVKMSDL